MLAEEIYYFTECGGDFMGVDFQQAEFAYRVDTLKWSWFDAQDIPMPIFPPRNIKIITTTEENLAKLRAEGKVPIHRSWAERRSEFIDGPSNFVKPLTKPLAKPEATDVLPVKELPVDDHPGDDHPGDDYSVDNNSVSNESSVDSCTDSITSMDIDNLHDELIERIMEMPYEERTMERVVECIYPYVEPYLMDVQQEVARLLFDTMDRMDLLYVPEERPAIPDLGVYQQQVPVYIHVPVNIPVYIRIPVDVPTYAPPIYIDVPVSMAIEAFEESVETITESVETITESVETITEPLEAITESVEAIEESVEEFKEPLEAIQESVEEFEEPLETIEEPVEEFEEPLETIEEPVEAIEKSVEEFEEPLETIEEPVEAIEKSVEAIVGIQEPREAIKEIVEPVEAIEEIDRESVDHSEAGKALRMSTLLHKRKPNPKQRRLINKYKKAQAKQNTHERPPAASAPEFPPEKKNPVPFLWNATVISLAATSIYLLARA
jgi:prefoldin subunit 5